MDWDNIIFNAATLIAGIFMLDYGADKFLDHTVIVGQRLGISPTLIALLTAGAEYEELAVVVAAIAQGYSPLALGNVVGSAISNILGAFSLGILFHPGRMEFDQSAKIYSALSLFVTTLFMVLAVFDQLNEVTGGLLIAGFLVYIVSIGYAIYRGVTEAPQLSDDDGSSASNSDDDLPVAQDDRAVGQDGNSEDSPLLRDPSTIQEGRGMNRTRSLFYHLCQLLFGLLALSLSGYIIAHSAGALTNSLQLSSTVFGLTVIAFATTLPEKFISVLSGSRGQGGIVAATTAGSNIFLLTICIGIVAVTGIPVNRADNFVQFELATVWISALCFVGIVFLGPSRIAGLALLAAYVVFLVLEFTVYKR
ncbi:Sodium/calcium exchanger MaX1 [Penicillium rolfsii]|nr:Sodium/calcium exchanger MaX1 [Penicillium rolfsii]